jgi:hypothetical protein
VPVLVRVRLVVPDRPGALGQVASAIGAAGADVVQVEVIGSENGRAVDDVHVQVRDTSHLERVVAELTATAGVDVEGVLHSPPPVTGHAELELVARLVAQPERALRTLVDGAPAAVGAAWAALLGATGNQPLDVVDTLVLPGVHAPDVLPEVASGLPLRVSSPRLTLEGGRAPAGCVLVPVGTGDPMALLVVREVGPAFHRSETWRLAEIARTAGAVAQRTPVAG